LNLLYFAAVLVISLVYVWTIYNLPILFVGVRDLRRTGKKRVKVSMKKSELPFFSIIVPVKDEESVVARLLDALLNSNYAKDRREIVVVEDGSVDQTGQIAKGFERDFPGEVKVVRKETSDGKPSALMEALKHVRGEIVGVFDADSVPDKDALLRVAAHFRDSSVDAVQGRICAINSDQNMLTKFVAQEELVRYEAVILFARKFWRMWVAGTLMLCLKTWSWLLGWFRKIIRLGMRVMWLVGRSILLLWLIFSVRGYVGSGVLWRLESSMVDC
jgi:cellulose synthase/poly-beta-1,6-N-acetylglucosamine synthase-like glycosyltransferase